MGILDTFYILFKTDADSAADSIKKVDASADEAEKAVEGLDKAFGDAARGAKETAAATNQVGKAAASADVTAQRLSRSFMSMARTFAAPLLAAASFTGMSSLATQRASEIRELDRYSAKLNSSIADVDAFQRSIQGLGGQGASAIDSLTKLGEKVNEAFADKDSGARKDMQAWGVAFQDTEGRALGATAAMLELAGSLEKVSQAEALARIKKLGIEDATTIELLLKGRAEMERHIETQKEMGVVTEEQARITREYYRELGTAGNRLTSFGNKIVEMLLPGITRSIRAFNDILDWTRKNRGLVEGFFIGVAGVITAVYLPAIARAAFATAALLLPYLAIGAAVLAVGAAFALVYEDIKAFVDGHPSLIGRLAEDYEWIGTIVEALSKAIKWLLDVDVAGLDNIVKVLLGLAGLSAAASAVGLLTAAMNPLTAALLAFAGAFLLAKAGLEFLSKYDNLGDAVTGFILGDGPDGKVQANPRAEPGHIESGGYDEDGNFIYMDGNRRVDRPAENTTSGFTEDALDYKFMLQAQEAVRAGVRDAQTHINNAENSPMGAVTPGSIAAENNVHNETNVSVGSVVVHTQATDAKGVAAAVRSELTNQLRNAASDFDTGVVK